MSTPVSNWITAMSDEIQVHHRHYADLAKRADDMGQQQVSRFLRAILAAETARAELYREHLAEVESETQAFDYYICPQCGVALTLAPPDHCPLCGTVGTQFNRVS